MWVITWGGDRQADLTDRDLPEPVALFLAGDSEAASRWCVALPVEPSPPPSRLEFARTVPLWKVTCASSRTQVSRAAVRRGRRFRITVRVSGDGRGVVLDVIPDPKE